MVVKSKKAVTGRGRGRPAKAVKDDEVNGTEKAAVAKPVKTIEKASSGKKRGRPAGTGKKAGKKSKATPKKKKAMSESEESEKEAEAVDGNESDDERAYD